MKFTLLVFILSFIVVSCQLDKYSCFSSSDFGGYEICVDTINKKGFLNLHDWKYGRSDIAFHALAFICYEKNINATLITQLEIVDKGRNVDTMFTFKPDEDNLKKMTNLFNDSLFQKVSKEILNKWTFENIVFQDIILEERNNESRIYNKEYVKTFLHFLFYSFSNERGLNKTKLIDHLTLALLIETRKRYRAKLKSEEFSQTSEIFIEQTTTLISLISPKIEIESLLNKFIQDLNNGNLSLGG